MNALAMLYDESATLVFSLVLHILQDRKTAEDALMDIYLRVRHESPKFDPRSQTPFTWLITLARNHAVDCRRTRLPLPTIREQQSIIGMAYLEGLTTQEIADRLGRSREYVTKQIVAGMNKLRMH